MMATVCRAKNPTSCRVHGNGGMMERLTALNEEAYVNNDVLLYMKTRDQIEALSDDSETPSFIAPDRGDLILGNWTNQHGEIIPEAPNDMLLSNLYQSSYMPVDKINQVEDMLADRGYDQKDLFLAKHFSLKKGDPDSKYTEVAKTEVNRAAMDIEKIHGVEMDRHDRDIFTEQYFYFHSSLDTTVTKYRCQKFMDEYEAYVQNYNK